MSSSGGTHKIVLLGEGRVGKTSLVSRFVKGKFSDTEESTVQANMYNKKKVNVDGKTVDLSIWDTAGQERFHALGPIYYRNAAGAVLVYDITDADTFEKVKTWVKELRQVVGDSIQLVICGNKGDMEKDRAVEIAMAEKYAKTQNAKHFTTSAKADMNVQEAFEALAAAIMLQVGEVADGIGKVSAPRKRKGVKVDLSGADGPSGSSGVYDSNPPSSGANAQSAVKPQTITLGESSPNGSGGGGGANGAAKKKPCCGKS